jgi:hypothetical protein
VKTIELLTFYIIEKGETVNKYINPKVERYYEYEVENPNITDIVMPFFDQVLDNIIGLRV